MENLLKETEEKKIHVLYYKVGANMQGLSRIMQQLRNLYGNRIIALPKDVTKLEKDALSLQDLLNIRSTINLLIMDKLKEENQNIKRPPDMRAGAVLPPNAGRIPPQSQRPPMSPQGNLRPGGGYQPQGGPQRPPAPPTSGSNAVKAPPSRGFIQGINVPLTTTKEN